MKERMIEHGRDKEPESGDPMELVMNSIPAGDPVMLARCVIEEYAMMGMNEEEILELFRQPIYQTHGLHQERGETWVRNLIQEVLGRTGRLRVSVKHFYHDFYHIGGCDD
jgi:hypothetical protein